MQDNITDKERAEAWSSTWDQSLTGKAIIERDGTFRSVNTQFWRLLQVTPSELIGNKFQDITPTHMRKVDEENARLLADGEIPFYVMPKTYEFSNGQRANIILEVTRVPSNPNRKFKFFVANILLDDNKGPPITKPKLSEYQQSYQKQTSTAEALSTTKETGAIVLFLRKYGKWLAAIGSIIAGILTGFM